MRTILIIGFLLLAGCVSQPADPVVLRGMTMGTTYSITLTTAPAKPVDEIQADIDALLATINNQMSTYIDDSELSQINQIQTSDWQSLSPELYTVISNAQEISRLTDGAFDITVGNLVNLWGFGPDERLPAIPDDESINTVMTSTGYQNIELQSNPDAIRKLTGSLYIDLSAIAKGYAVDRLAEYLDQLNITNYLVDIGGEIKARGQNNQQLPWRIGIEKPMIDGRDVQRVISLQNTAMATSGDYRNFIMQDGVRYSHAIDPRTGRPVVHTLLSVTVLNESTMVADALATALLVMGADNGIKFAEKNAIPAYFIQSAPDNMREIYSSDFFPYISDSE